MKYSSRKSTHRRRKSDLKDRYIDKQIIILHKAMAKKLLANPDLIEGVRGTLEQRKEQGKIHYGGYITWLSILDIYEDKQAFIHHITENTEQMRRLRRKTPLVGILTEEERQEALIEDAIGPLKDIDFLY